MSAGDKHTYVGNFFETLTQEIMGGVICRDNSGDVYIPSEGITLEVKGSGSQSSYGFRLSIEQIRKYKRRVEESKSKAVWYMLFAYKNTVARTGESRKRKTELSFHKKERANPSLLG